MERAKERLAAYPPLADEMLADLKANPRPVNQDDGAVLLTHLAVLRNENNTAASEVNAARELQNEPARLLANQRYENSVKALDEFYDVAKKTGTEAALGFGFRKALVKQDYTLDAIIRDWRAAQGGEPLTGEQMKQAEDIAREHADLQASKAEYAAEAEEKNIRRVAEETLGDIVSEVEKAAPISKKLERLSTRVLERLDERAESARTRLREKFGRTAAVPVDPTMIADLAEILAPRIARGIIDVARLTADLIQEFGEAVSPFIDDAMRQAAAMVETESRKTAPSKRTRAAMRKAMRGPVEQRQQISERILEKAQTGRQNEIGPQVQDLARFHIEAGVRELDPLLDLLHEDLQQFFPEITRRETMDALSGYGRYQTLSKNEIDVALRDLRGQAQQTAKIMDMEAGLPPRRTGFERRAPTRKESRLIREVNEAKKRLGIQTTDPETQLRTSLQQTETRLRNSIEDMWAEITSGEQVITERAEVPESEAIRGLRNIHSEVREIYDTVFPREPRPGRELTDEQRVQLAMRGLERAIEAKRRMIETGEIGPKPKPPSKTPETVELKARRAENEALQNTLELMRLIAKPDPDPDMVANRIYLSRKRAQIADMERRIAKGDFAKREPKPFKKDERSREIDRQITEVRKRYNEAKLKAQLERRTPYEKGRDIVSQTIHTIRTLLTSWDLSAPGRQGAFIATAHPVQAAKAFGKMMRALRSEKGYDDLHQDIDERPNRPLYDRSGLFLAERNSIDMNAMEEAFMSRWIDALATSKVPGVREIFKGVRATQRAYVAFLNVLRADSFDAMAATLSSTGTPTDIEMKAIANYINMATGRGSFGRLDPKLGPGANLIFFAPRYVASRFNMIAGSPLYRGTARTRKLIAKEYGRYLTGLGVVYGLASLAGFETEWDPRSSAFGKLKIGNSTIDVLGGLSQVTTLVARTIPAYIPGIHAKKKTMAGALVPLTYKSETTPAYGQADLTDVWKTFFRTKFAPHMTFVVDTGLGRNVIGEPVTVGGAVRDLVTPIAIQDVIESMREYGISKGGALGLVGMLGFSTQTIPAEKMEELAARQKKAARRAPVSIGQWRSRRAPGSDKSVEAYQQYRANVMEERRAAREFLESRQRR
jgi:hypothetical protein